MTSDPGAGALLDDDVLQRLGSGWGKRCGDPVPWAATVLLRVVLLAVAAYAPASVGVAEAAAGLGVLRARQGHGAAGLVEDLLALRPHVEGVGGGGPRLTECIEQALRAGVGALACELAELGPTDAPTRDPLTGVLTRAVFEEALTHEVLSASRHGAPSLVVVDLDGLTRFMEVQGHLAGDLHLVRMTEILTAASRRSDVLGRLGVDQLALVLPRTELTRALVVARRVLARSLADARAVERAEPGSLKHAPRLSVGVGWLAAPNRVGDLLAAAEQAVDRARRAGGSVVECNRPDPEDVPRVAPPAVAPTGPLVVR